MKAELKRLHSPDVASLEGYQPADQKSFGLFVQAIVGPAGEDGEESFDFMLCTPLWLAERSTIVLGEHHLIVHEYDYAAIENFLRDFCARCEGNTWGEVARRLSSLGRWEFADYAP
jgi:hypothetical protein